MRSRIIMEGVAALLLIAVVSTCQRSSSSRSGTVPVADDVPGQSASVTVSAQRPSRSARADTAADEMGAGQTVAANAGQVALVTAQDADAVVNVRSQPSEAGEPIGVGQVGDEVRLGRAETAADGYVWYQVTFSDADLAGWIREDFLEAPRGADPAVADSDSPSAAASTTEKDVLKDALDETCGSAKTLEAYFITQSHTIYLCKVRGRRLYLSQEEGTENVIVSEEVEPSGGGYLITNGDYEYRLDSRNFVVVRVDDARQQSEVLRESVVYTERY